MSSDSTLSAVAPATIECTPQELLPSMPPSVQRLCVAGSGPYVRSCASACSPQPVEHEARLDPRPPGVRVELDQSAQVLAEADQHGLVDRLPGKAGARPAGEDRRFEPTAETDRRDPV